MQWSGEYAFKSAGHILTHVLEGSLQWACLHAEWMSSVKGMTDRPLSMPTAARVHGLSTLRHQPHYAIIVVIVFLFWFNNWSILHASRRNTFLFTWVSSTVATGSSPSAAAMPGVGHVPSLDDLVHRMLALRLPKAACPPWKVGENKRNMTI